MRDNFLSINDNNKVLMETQSLNSITSSSITEMRCRCAESRRINNTLILWERRNRKRIEYKRLRDSVPSIARRRVSNLTIITEAARLIDKLEAAVLNKFQSEGIPKFLQGIEIKSSSMNNELRIEDVKHLMLQLMSKEKKQKSRTKSLKH